MLHIEVIRLHPHFARARPFGHFGWQDATAVSGLVNEPGSRGKDGEELLCGWLYEEAYQRLYFIILPISSG